MAHDKTIRVLLVEDNRGDSRLIEILLDELTHLRFDLTVCDTLAEARALADTGTAAMDVVLLDLGLPDSQGLDTLARMHAAAPDLPIVVMSGLDDHQTALAAVRQGAQDYVVKGKGDGDLIARALLNAMERHRVQRQLLVAETLFQNSDTGMMVTDSRGTVIRVNPAYLRITGFAPGDVVGSVSDLFAEDQGDPTQRTAMRADLARIGIWEGEIWTRCKDGHLQPDWVRVNAVVDADGHPLAHVVVYSDLTFRRRVEEDLVRQATTDPLTGLSNRLLLEKMLAATLQRACRYDRVMGVLFVDLDGFKDVNDRFGHEAGDALLREVAHRLRAVVRASDEVGRLGGDEFVIILSELQSTEDAEIAALKVVEALQAPCLIKGETIQIGASVGLACCPLHGSDPIVLLHAADEAMYLAKRRGRNRHAVAPLPNGDGK